MDFNKDYYAILGVDKKATQSDIDSAYRKLMRKWHPDLFASKSKEEQEKATQMSADINEAHDVLSNPKDRNVYDITRNGGGRQRFSHGMDGFSPFGGFDPFDGFGHFHSARREHYHEDRSPRRGQDIGINVALPFEDFFFGCTKTLEIKVKAKCSHCSNGLTGDVAQYSKCPVCGGEGMTVMQRGNMVIQETCRACGGTGEVLSNGCPHCNGTSVDGIRTQTIEFTIPKRSCPPFNRRYSSVGHCGVYGGDAGDIIVNVEMSDDGMFFKRRDGSLGTVHFISLFKALAGGVETILTPYGNKNVMLPSGMKDGYEMKFGGMGLHDTKGKDADLVVTFKYDMPNELTPKIVEELSKIAEKTDSDKKCFPNVAAERKYASEYISRLG